MNTRALTAATVVIAAAGSAMADTIDLRFSGVGHGRNVRIQFGSRTFNAFSGQLNHQFSNGTGSLASLAGNFPTFCSDITEYVSSSGRTYDRAPVSQLPVSSGQPAMGADAAQAIADIFVAADGSQRGSSDADDYFSAMQLLIWEIVYDYDANVGSSSIDVTSGQVRFSSTNGSPLSSAISTQMSSIINDNLGNNNPMSRMLGFANEGAQDQLFYTVPTPGAAAVFLGGLGLIASRRRRG